MSSISLHDELMTFKFAGWHSYTILHAMIDAGIITEFKCQATTCLMPTREFVKAGPRGTPDLLVIDHIVPRRDKGSHKIENLRIMHNSCNAGWRKGITGSFHTDATKAVIRDKVKQAHADGKLKKIYTPERSAKISAALKGKPLSDEHRAKISQHRTGTTMSPETKQKISEYWRKRREEKGVE